MKKKQPKRTTVALNTRISVSLDAALRAFSESRNEKIRDVIEVALRRHMDSPPPQIQIPPLPPISVKK